MSYIGKTPDSLVTGQSTSEDIFTATSGQTAFTLTADVTRETDIVVAINGVVQSGTAYGMSGTGNRTLTFTAGLTAGDEVRVLHIGFKPTTNVTADDTVSTAKIVDDAVTTAKIADDAVDGTKLADNACNSEHYTDGSIDNAHLADDAVGIAELSATGTASSSTFLRGDNSWAATPSEITKSSSDPTISTNPSGGVGTVFLNTTSGEMFVCTDATAGENVWTNVGAGSGDIQPKSYFGGRGLFFGGHTGSANTNVIDYITIANTGNATDFGDMTNARHGHGACSNGTRGVAGIGWASAYTNALEYVTIASTGNATDFGDATVARGYMAALSDGIRGLWGGGGNLSGYTNIIDYITMATTGNATDFGDLLNAAQMSGQGCSNGTRGVWAGQRISGSPNENNVIQYVVVATTSNAIDFGDLTAARQGVAACSNETRGVFGGGQTSGSRVNIIEYITIASTGNSTDFGDLTQARYNGGACANATRGVWGGGESGGTFYNILDYVTIANTGNATDFGDLTAARNYNPAASGD